MDSPLHAACITGDLEGLRGMLKGSYSSANDPDAAMGWTPLHFAAKFGRLDIVSALLEPPEKAYTPALVDPATPDGQTPLHMACAAGHEGVVRELLVHGASAARQENQLGYTALHFAASQARAALVGLLVQHGADVHAADKFGSTPLHEASHWSTHAEALAALLAHGADPQRPDNTGESVAAIIARRGLNMSLDAPLQTAEGDGGAGVLIATPVGEAPPTAAAAPPPEVQQPPTTQPTIRVNPPNPRPSPQPVVREVVSPTLGVEKERDHSPPVAPASGFSGTPRGTGLGTPQRATPQRASPPRASPTPDGTAGMLKQSGSMEGLAAGSAAAPPAPAALGTAGLGGSNAAPPPTTPAAAAPPPTATPPADPPPQWLQQMLPTTPAGGGGAPMPPPGSPPQEPAPALQQPPPPTAPPSAPSPDLANRPTTWASPSPHGDQPPAPGASDPPDGQQQQRSYGEFAVNILAKQHPELDRLYIEAMAKQRDWSIEATDRFLTDEKNRSSVGAAPVGAATGAATGAPEWETMAGEFEGGGGGGGSAV